MGYCGCQTLVGYDPAGRTGVTLKCKSWTCEDCAPVRRDGLIALAIAGAPTTFLTLTSRRRDDLSPYAAARIISEAWKELRKRIVRTFKCKSPEFLAVFEATKLGWPHLHILMRSIFIPQDWLSEQWNKLTGSFVVDIRRVYNAAQGAAYCAKYVGKATHKFGTCKRYWTSKKFDPREKFVRGEYKKRFINSEVVPGNLSGIAEAWRLSGMNVTWRSQYEVRAEHPT